MWWRCKSRRRRSFIDYMGLTWILRFTPPKLAAIPAALEEAAQDVVALRTATPPDFIDYMGVALSDRQPERRAAFEAEARSMAEVGSAASLIPTLCHAG